MSRRPIALVLVVASASACIKMGPTADVTRYFVLAPDPAATTAIVNPDGPVIGVGPVTIPDYLDRKAIVTRVGPGEVNPSETNLWAEPLGSMVQQTLAANLTARLGASRSLRYPWRRNVQPDVVVEVDVLRFEATTEGTVVLDAAWSVTAGDRQRHGTTALAEPVGGAGPDAQVAAMGRVLGRLADELAAVNTR